MATVTWKGEGPQGPSSIDWRGITFPVGKPVEVSDPWVLAKAKGNKLFEVEGADDVAGAPTPDEPKHDPHRPRHEPVDTEDDHPHRRKHR